MNPYINKITQLSKKLKSPITIMEVCGGHTNTIMKYGIRDLLPTNIKLISGPGCPVCVTDQTDIDAMLTLAENGIPIATYGDMLRVPGSNNKSLAKSLENGADVKVILSVEEILNDQDKNRIFFGIGFETTTPMTAFSLKNNITVYSTHKTMPEPMKFLVETSDINGFIDPGHVSAITGEKIWHDLPEVAQVISGFKPEQIIRGIYKLLKLIVENKKEVINDYPEVVSYEGNILAQNLINETMKPCAALWRGMGAIPNSGLEPKNDNLNAKIKFADIIKKAKTAKIQNGCRCGEILQGKCDPQDCPFFANGCTPETPIGACMVSETEGACGIEYKFKN